ncbi:hypothetical protein LTR15_007585 [Elasticomyces elasticus]|nr:hypothetical protein LTR15_007585 [Elasticomyces elasticus]
MAVAYVAVVYGSKALPYWQNPVGAIHILGFFAYIIPIWVNAPKATHRDVWLTFENNGGWSSLGLSALVGQLTGISGFAGLDACVHMSEEVQDARRSVPRAMLTVWMINFSILFVAALTVCYHIIDVETSLEDPTTYPAIYVLRGAMSVGWITVILVIIVVLNIASNIVYLATVSRDLFAFSRDRGLPLSGWLSRVNTKRHIPQNAAMTSCVFAVLLALIYIGSPVAFYAMTSLATVALLQCYGLSIGMHLWRRINHPETLPPAHFALGKWGIPLNVLAIIYSAYGFFWAFWPQTTPVTAAGFNWASVIFVGVVLVAMVYFFFKAKHTYVGPVAEVEGRGHRMAGR